MWLPIRFSSSFRSFQCPKIILGNSSLHFLFTIIYSLVEIRINWPGSKVKETLAGRGSSPVLPSFPCQGRRQTETCRGILSPFPHHGENFLLHKAVKFMIHFLYTGMIQEGSWHLQLGLPGRDVRLGRDVDCSLDQHPGHLGREGLHHQDQGQDHELEVLWQL